MKIITYYICFHNKPALHKEMTVDEWTTVIHKENKKSINKTKNCTHSFQEIKEGIISVLEKYCPYAVYIYGSCARGTNNVNSDVDILTVWKCHPENLNDIKYEIINKINMRIDFVNLIYKEGKKIKVTDDRDIAYYENLMLDAINIYTISSKKIYLEDIIPYSIKIAKT